MPVSKRWKVAVSVLLLSFLCWIGLMALSPYRQHHVSAAMNPWDADLSGDPGQDAARLLQQSLNDLGYDAGSVDGLKGRQTQRAVEAFQEREGLTVNGALDTTTLELIKARAAEASL